MFTYKLNSHLKYQSHQISLLRRPNHRAFSRFKSIHRMEINKSRYYLWISCVQCNVQQLFWILYHWHYRSFQSIFHTRQLHVLAFYCFGWVQPNDLMHWQYHTELLLMSDVFREVFEILLERIQDPTHILDIKMKKKLYKHCY